MRVVDAADSHHSTSSPARTTSSSEIMFRPATTEDEEFLFCLYVAVRAPAFEAIDPERVAALLRQQFTAHEASHRALHPAATHHVVELDREPIGQCRLGPHPDPVTRDRPDGDALVLVDLTVLPEHRDLTGDVVSALHRHADWFGVTLWPDESACTRDSGPTVGCPAHYGAADDST